MRTRIIMNLCGMAMGAALCATAVAQQQYPQPGDTTRTDKDKVQPGGITSRGEAIPAPMKTLDGVWRVEIQLTPKYWELEKGMKTDQPGRPDPSKPDTGKPSGATPPGNEGQPGISDSTGTKTTTGFAENRFTLGSSAFEQNIVVPDVASIIGDKPGLSTQPGPFRGMMLMTFDNSAHSYNVAFSCNKNPQIHMHSGTYDVSGNRVLFNVNESIGMRDTNKPGGAESRSTASGKSPQVILEVVSPTRYRVSMYANEAGTPRDSTQPGRDTNQPGRDTAQPGIGGEPSGQLVYRATYTKAEGAEVQNFRRIIQEGTGGGVTQVPDTSRP